MSPQYIIGIDLGTTNCAVAYVQLDELSSESPDIRIFDIPQLTRAGAVETRPLLPSFVYLPGSGELPAGSTQLPWDKNNSVIVGELARTLGASVPGRLISSAKSWLCSPSVDRTASILPWGAPEGVARMSPVEASALYLAHIRQAWDHAFAKRDKEKKLAAQEIVITVPASFDEAARELTVEAARRAGLPKFTLLEEPQAAFYAWVAENIKKIDENLAGIRLVLVCDVGGGTTDFSLIEVLSAVNAGKPMDLKRIAVGDHLMLGGDNMDLALARHLEKKIPSPLDAHQFKALTAAARQAKEQILVDGALSPVIPIAIMGRGSQVIGGSLRTELTRVDADRILLDGFFPLSEINEDPIRSGRAGIREWGLPYVHDPAVTRHLSQFLRHHLSVESSLRPDAVLFNGGAVKPGAFRSRILDTLKKWFGADHSKWAPIELKSVSLDLAVAIGAAYYGCVRHVRHSVVSKSGFQGMRIGGGMGRAYYIGIETNPEPGQPAKKAAICLVPQGTEEGGQLELNQTFILRLATPVVFPVFSSTVRPTDELGSIVREDDTGLAPLPPLETVLHAGRRSVKRDVAVRMQAQLTEVGTLALALKSVHDDRTWEVHLNVRSRLNPPIHEKQGADQFVPGQGEGGAGDAGFGVDPRKLEAALSLLVCTFDPQSRNPIPPNILTKQLEGALQQSKEAWSATLARRLSEAVLDQAGQRKRSAEHESRWLNLIGFLLRPGFGCLADAERMKRLYNATREELNFISDPNCRIEWWVLWRRVSGGLKEDHERELFRRLLPFLSDERDVAKRGGWPRPSKGELPEMWRAAASLELLDTAQKKLMGTHLLDRLENDGPSTAMLWALGRLGARVPAHAAANRTVPVELAESWLKALLAMDWAGNPTAVFAVVSLARKTGDRSRDISAALRARSVARLQKMEASEHDISAVTEVTGLESSDRKMIFGDVLPPALRM